MKLEIKLKNPKYCGSPYNQECPCLDWSSRINGEFICRQGYDNEEFFPQRELNTIADKKGCIKKIIRPQRCIKENGE